MDWFEVQYESSFDVSADSLKFSHSGGFRYTITGFSTGDAELFDITSTGAVKRVVNGQITGTGPYTLEAEPAGASGARRYLAVASDAIKTPSAVIKDRASSLASTANAADWILITHRELGWEASGAKQPWVKSLVNLRQTQGLRTKVVDVQDIFDEFGYGFATPQAIKDFISYAYTNWQSPVPQYVLLVGDTSYDYKDNWNIGTKNYVPGHLIYTEHLGETIADDWYVQVSGQDAVADLYIGRLPANSAAQAADMVSKIVSYEITANTQRWEKRMVFSADNQTEDWEAVFETMNEDAAWYLSPSIAQPLRFYLQEYEDEQLAVSDLTADFLSAVDAGALIVNYAGHGSVNLWANERMLDNRGAQGRSDLSSLTNKGRYPFVVNMACLTGYFIYPQAGPYAADAWRSLAEGWLWPADAGAIAALMPTGMTAPEGQHILSNALFEAIFALDKRELGQAVAYAKEQLLANGGAGAEETANTFMYFGDPATSLKLVQPRRPQGLMAERQADGAVELSWTPARDCDGQPVAGYQLYRRSGAEKNYTQLNTALIPGLSYSDRGLSQAPAGTTYYYALRAVDDSAQASVPSAPAVVTIVGGGNTGGSASSSNGGGCFISSANWDLSPDLLNPLGAMALLGCLIWYNRRKRR